MTDEKAWLRTGIPRALAAVFGVLMVAQTLSIFVAIPLIPTDLSTYVLPAVAREANFGFLYVDLLDVKPPLTFAFFVPWIAIFGHSLMGLWIFYSLLLLVLFSLFYIALEQELAPWFATLTFVFALIAMFTFGMLEEFLFTTEAIGSTAVLLGLVVVRWKSQNLAALFAGAVLLGAAGQVKDVFLLVPLALIPIALSHPRRLRALTVAAVGVGAAILGTVAVLLWWGPGVLPAYIEVLQIKRQRFPLPDAVEIGTRLTEHIGQVGQWLPLLWLFAVACIAAAILSLRANGWNRTAFLRDVSPSSAEWMIFTYLAAIYLGFLWQGSDLLKTYALAVVFPVYLGLAVFVRMAFGLMRPASRGLRAAVIVVLIVGLAPAPQALLFTAGRTAALPTLQLTEHLNRAESPEVLRPYEVIRDLAEPDDCIHVAYAWSATVDYLYTELPPCNRIVLPPLASQMPSLAAELKSALINNPPDIIVADPTKTAIFPAAFPYEDLLENCYVRAFADPTVFLIREDLPATSACLERQLAMSVGTLP